VQRYAISERDDQKLIQPVDNFLLNKIKEFKQFMAGNILKKNIPQINLDRYNSYSLSIVDNRLLKLLKLAKTELSLDDERRLTISEKLLFEILFNLIKHWRNFFINSK
jgi:DNA replication initiation complex subunit (GINS family)